MKKNGVFSVSVIVCLLAVSSVIAQDSLNMNLIGRAIGGRGLSGNFVGTTMLLGTENALLALNVATPSSPILVGERFIEGGITNIAISGDIVALALRDRGVQLVDLSAPAVLNLMGFYSIDDTVSGVAFYGSDYLLVASRGGGLIVLDISDPFDISEVSTLPAFVGARRIVVDGHIAYTTLGINGIAAAELASIDAPYELGRFDPGGTATGLDVVGEYAYIADGLEGLKIVSVSDPTNITDEGGCATTSYAMDVRCDGDYAYVADNTGGLRIIDISSHIPSEVASIGATSSDYAYSLTLAGGIAYTVFWRGGLRSYDISTPSSPSLIGQYLLGIASAEGITGLGNRLYVAGGDDGIGIFDITDPSRPFLLGYTTDAVGARRLLLQDDMLYAAAGDNGFYSVNVSYDLYPAVVGSANDSLHFVMDIAGGSEDRIYAADGNYLLTVIDISDSSRPSFDFDIDLLPDDTVYSYSIAVSGDYAFIAEQYSGFFVVDISDTPVVVAEIDSLPLAQDIYIDGDVAYLSCGPAGLWAVDISNPLAPIPFAHYATNAQAAVANGGYVYIANGVNGLQAVRIDGVSDPELVGYYTNTAGFASHLYKSGHTVYLADGYGGLYILDVFDVEAVSEQGKEQAPASVALSAYPNPFNANSVVSVFLPMGRDAEIAIMDITGRQVSLLHSGYLPAGRHSFTLSGAKLASGTYLVRLAADNVSQTTKILLIR